MKRAPRPLSDSTATRPPRASRIRRTVARPIPVPGARLSSTLKKGSKILSCTSFEIPGPVSSTIVSWTLLTAGSSAADSRSAL